MEKSQVYPIQCSETAREVIQNNIPCPVAEFPCNYLGLPLSNRKLHRADLLFWVEKIADRLPAWKAHLMNMAGRKVMVQFVLAAIPIHLLIAINVNKWMIKAINRIMRGFLWKGREHVQGGFCLVAWDKVQRPIDLGGLGIQNLEVMAWSLQMRWLWFAKTQVDRPWNGLELPAHANVKAMFKISIISNVGNGQNTLFWTDRWIHGCSVSDLAPLVFAQVPARTAHSRTVAQALTDQRWEQDIVGALSAEAFYEYYQLWSVLLEFHLDLEEDQHHWVHESSGIYSSKSAYRAYFQGSITFEPWKRIWKSWAPGKCKLFLWLAIRNRCWTADRLQRRGLPHPARCVLCDQEEENVQHILTSCVFAREFWVKALSTIGVQNAFPHRHERSFADWWRRAEKRAGKGKKGVNSAIILGAWTLWKVRNRGVFDGILPSMQSALSMFKDEAHWWWLAGAKKLQELPIGRLGLGT